MRYNYEILKSFRLTAILYIKHLYMQSQTHGRMIKPVMLRFFSFNSFK